MQLEWLLADPAVVEKYRDRALQRAQEYSWEAVTDRYEELLNAVRRTRGGHTDDLVVEEDPLAVA